MNAKHLQKHLATLLLSAGLALSGQSQANTLTIDDFSHSQSVMDDGGSTGSTSDTVSALTGTDLSNASRTFIAEASGDRFANTTEIVSGDNQLIISNDGRSAGSASILWNFDALDLTAHGNAIQLEVLAIDLGVNVEMVANGSSSSGIKTFTGNNNYLVSFSDFTNPAAFANLHSFRLNFTGPEKRDGQFRLLTTTTPVPVPAAFGLMSSALLGFIATARRKPLS
ncbi:MULTISPECIES: hypothetical protein [Methylomonas]|uniref:PEP-CTERM sorting domain-containing protein n=2 Tax=Methylomonas TaxID=416 RepID=A0A126T236_9GAMM|nr:MULTISPECIES: hypothetical protein [Methylomonas]AMK76150.1 hypothetical protein JT25_006540 [Methylomonas denitrificans]OAH96066.1 hypothetical protein A1342_14170 [Methylomonas methanica]TCV81351.1 hypothetical protein EDE11_11552 [Methylomonas methanica]